MRRKNSCPRRGGEAPPSVSAGSGPWSLSAQLASAWRRVRMPGMTLETAGWEAQKRKRDGGQVRAIQVALQRVTCSTTCRL